MTHVQSGALTQDALDRALQERAIHASNSIEYKQQEVIAEIDREIEAVYQSLPESQRQRFTENVDRQTRIDTEFKARWAEIFKPEESERFSWQTDLIAKLVQDPELEKLAASIRTKEHSMNYITMDPSSMDSYSNSPLGGPLVALLVQKAAQSPTTLQSFVSNAIAGSRGIWGSPEYTPDRSQENVHTISALLKTGYPAAEISGIICNALIAAKLPVFGLETCKSYIAQLSPEDYEIIKTHYVQKFAQSHVINICEPIDSLAFFQIESFLDNPHFLNDIPRKKFSWMSLHIDSSDGIGPLADVLLQGYDINTVVPILEAYQGNRALDGSLSAAKMVSNVRAYLNERTKKTPTTPEANSDLQLN